MNKRVILSENEFRQKIAKIYLEEQEKFEIKEKWNKLNKREKKLVIELHNVLNPNKKVIINEAKWYNTVMDFLGFLPVVGTPIDLYNGYSYWRQGDILFALLSWISAVPLVGDIAGGVLKGSLKSIKNVKDLNILKVALASKDSKQIANAAIKVGGPAVNIIGTTANWSGKVLKMLEQTAKYFPFLGKGFIKTIKSWFEVLGFAGKELKSFESLGKQATTKLMKNTKWYLGWLDWYGLGNFKGSEEELRRLVPDLDEKVAQYASTPESRAILAQSNERLDTIKEPTPIPSGNKIFSDNPIEDILNLILK